MRALRRVERLLLWPLKPPLACSGYVRMSPDGRLRDYPFVVVRFACRECPRLGRYRLAVLAERFGADETASRGRAEAGLGGGKRLRGGLAERHVQSRLAVGDVEAGHGGLSIGVKNPPSWPT